MRVSNYLCFANHFHDYKTVQCAWPPPAYSTMTLSTPPLFIISQSLEFVQFNLMTPVLSVSDSVLSDGE